MSFFHSKFQDSQFYFVLHVDSKLTHLSAVFSIHSKIGVCSAGQANHLMHTCFVSES